MCTLKITHGSGKILITKFSAIGAYLRQIRPYFGNLLNRICMNILRARNNDNSSIRKHLRNYDASPKKMTVRILEEEKRKGNLHIREAFYLYIIKV